MEFQKWASIPRLSKELVTVTEKIDGTNSCIRIRPVDSEDAYGRVPLAVVVLSDTEVYYVWAQSRTRFIFLAEDNFGFARWVYDNAPELVKILGVGDHYGEWWGSKIQRGYGLDKGERAFSLFNAPRWSETLHHNEPRTSISNLYVVPTLYTGSLYDLNLSELREDLEANGSVVQPGFKAEGMIVYLRELKASYKVLLENDELHKWQVAQ